MTLAELNLKIDALPPHPSGGLASFLSMDRGEARITRDTRLGILGVHAGMEPTEDQCQIIYEELFGNPAVGSQRNDIA